MKCLKLSVFIICSFLTFSASAALITNLEIESVENNKEIKLSIESQGSGLIEISIWKKKNCFIKSTYEGLNLLERQIDFSNQEKGLYVLKVEDQSEIKEYDLTVDESGVKVDKSSLKRFYKPSFSHDNSQQLIRVNWLMDNFYAPNIIIINQNGQSVLNRKFKKCLILKKQFSLKIAEKGDYKMIIKNKRFRYTYNFSI